MKRCAIVLVATLSAHLFISVASAATIYNPQTAFSGSNPSGVWSYGLLDTGNSNPASNFAPFSTYSTNNDASGVNVWTNTPSAPYPGIFDNTNSTTTTVHGTIEISGQTLALHPPNDATQTDLRFTAPANLTIGNIAATFSAADTSGTTSDVHVYVNGVDKFDSTVTAVAGGGATSFNSGPFTLLAGQTIDFRVGDGGNGYGNDGTRLVASITAVPEPSSIALACMAGLALLVMGGKRVRRQA